MFLFVLLCCVCCVGAVDCVLFAFRFSPTCCLFCTFLLFVDVLAIVFVSRVFVLVLCCFVMGCAFARVGCCACSSRMCVALVVFVLLVAFSLFVCGFGFLCLSVGFACLL